MKKILKSTAKALLPRAVVERLRRASGVPPVRWGDLRRTTPIARGFGFERSEPIDRYFIHKFLAQNSDAVRGRVLELGDREYTVRFGGERVTQSDVLNGLTSPELTERELDEVDPEFVMLVTARAQKP